MFHVLVEGGLFKFMVKTPGCSRSISLKIPLGSVQKYPQLSQLMVNRELIVCRFWWQGDRPSFAKVEG